MLNEVNLRTQGVTGSWPSAPAQLPGVADDPFGSDEALDAFLQDWTQSGTSSLDTLAQVASAPAPPPSQPAADDATWQIEHLVARNRSVFAKAADDLGPRENAPSRLLMTDDAPQFGSTDPKLFDDAQAWKLFDQQR